MATLFLHIGHSKTGSSYLQACALESRNALEEKGIHYPDPTTRTSGIFASFPHGNGVVLRNYLTGKLDAPTFPSDRDCLISNEGLFFELTDASKMDMLVAWARSSGFEKTEMLLFVRDPVDDMVSLYRQKVKSGETTESLKDYATHYTKPKLVKRLIDAAGKYPDINLTLRNYSKVKRSLVEAFAEWLGVPANSLAAPAQKVVNRSLSEDELETLKILNRHVGKDSRFAGLQLCADLPELDAGTLYVEQASIDDIYDVNRDAIDTVNRALPDGEHYAQKPTAEVRETERGDNVTLSTTQLDCIFAAMTKRTVELQEKIDQLKEKNRELNQKQKKVRERLQKLRGNSKRGNEEASEAGTT
ncbi:cell division protein ZapB [Microbaculum marinum]|uniref:Cell division protein ZapB n=1 Tax=Microbaculum marinum TaxID=1764581 RepID=A0AAW9RVK4_9HYPH